MRVRQATMGALREIKQISNVGSLAAFGFISYVELRSSLIGESR